MQPAVTRFVDTNILLYAISRAPEEARKRAVALDLLAADDLALSVQVFQEFYYRATRPKFGQSLRPDYAINFLETLTRFPVQDMTVDIFEAAVAISRRFQLSYWDGAILAAARALGCDAVYSEDLSSQQDYDGLRVINPFREDTAVG